MKTKMKLLLRKTLYLLLIPPIVFLIGLLLPPTPLGKAYLLCAKPAKDSLLQNVKKPRIIFIAGSSMSFGLNSQIIKDSLHLNPINTGTHGGTGLYFMIDNTEKYIQSGDVIVLIAEYHQFYGNFADGGNELLRVIFDNSEPLSFLKLRKNQFLKTYPYIPKYAMQKFIPAQYFNIKMDPVYSKKCYNQYGDAVAHWDIKREGKVVPFNTIEGGDFNFDLLKSIVAFNKTVQSKGALLLVSFPPYQEESFNNCKDQIHFIEKELRNQDLKIIGTPERYIMTDDMIYDTPYHTNKNGANRRTQLLLEDLKNVLNLQ